MDHITRFHALYEAFNRRDIDAVLAMVSGEVDWPNAWTGRPPDRPGSRTGLLDRSGCSTDRSTVWMLRDRSNDPYPSFIRATAFGDPDPRAAPRVPANRRVSESGAMLPAPHSCRDEHLLATRERPALRGDHDAATIAIALPL